MQNSKFQIPNSKFSWRTSRAQAALSVVLLIGGILILVGLSITFLANSFVNSSYGYKLAQQAQAVATGGAYDALMQLSRDKDFGGVDPGTTYALAVGSNTATVTVVQDSPTAGEATIISTATISFRKKTLRIVVSRNASTSQITVLSWVQT
jgi:hypothetical protein